MKRRFEMENGKYVKGFFRPTPAAAARLEQIGFRAPRGDQPGWDSLTLPAEVAGEFRHTAGSPASAGRLSLVGE